MQPRRTAIENESGFALIATFLMLTLLLALGSASLVQSTIDLRATTSYKTGVQALMAAESGAIHGLSTINKKRVRNFKTDVVDLWNGSNAGSLLGPGQYKMLGDNNSGYSVTVAEDPTDLQNSGFIDSSGVAPQQALRVVRLQVRRANFVGTQGAITLIDDNFNSFDGDGSALTISGDDVHLDGTANPNGFQVPAITTQNDTVNKKVTDAIPNKNATQYTGLGYDGSDPSHVVPSVLALGAPSKQDIDDVVRDIVPPAPPNCPSKKAGGELGSPWVCQMSDKSINGDDLPMGTPEQPVIIHLTNSAGIKINGNWTGYGIIVADGPLDINGTADFFGLIVARGGFDTNMRGNATIRGSVWTYAPALDIGGSLLIQHSSEALQFADNAGLGSSMGGNLPRQMVVVGWDER
jgi:hypothetical protein